MPIDDIRALLESADDAYWEAVASRGLLRRAQKDLETQVPVTLDGEQAGFLVFTVAAFNIKIPSEGPARATCTCPAPGICQHIITACLYLRAGAAAPSARPGQARQELLAFTAEQLKRWAGAAVFRAAVRLLLEQPDVEIKEAGAITVRFTRLAAYCIYPPGAGLDGIVVTQTGPRSRRLAVAAVLAFQHHCGVRLADVHELAEPGTAPRSREQVIDGCLALLQEIVTVGLSHLTDSTSERLATLSLSALAVNLPRLSLALRDSSDHVDMLVERRAQADEARLLGMLSRMFGLADAIRSSEPDPRPDLVGQRRTEYYDVQSIELCGVAAYPWRTGSGYQGLTVLFWHRQDRRWLSWSDARPDTASTQSPASPDTGSRGFNPISRYDADGPWIGIRSPRQTSRTSIALTRARLNGVGRLSSTSACRASVLGPTPADDLDIGPRLFTTVAGLLEYAAGCRGIGLRDPNPLDSIVVFQPARWGPRAFDQINQRLIWLVADDTGRSIPFVVPYDPLHSAAIRWLESCPSLDGCKVIARLTGPLASLTLYPITLISHGIAPVSSTDADSGIASSSGAAPSSAIDSIPGIAPGSSTSSGSGIDSGFGENNIFHLALDSARTQPPATSLTTPSQLPQPQHPQPQQSPPGASGPQPSALPAQSQPGPSARPEAAELDDEKQPEDDEPDHEAESSRNAATQFIYSDPSLTRLEELLETLAESGAGSLNPPTRDRLRALSNDLASRGLILLARHTARLATGEAFARDLLRLSYLCDLHHQALSSAL
jgi:hypothetical protein